jgi:hypothetical protein
MLNKHVFKDIKWKIIIFLTLLLLCFKICIYFNHPLSLYIYIYIYNSSNFNILCAFKFFVLVSMELELVLENL